MLKIPFITKEKAEEIIKTYPTPFHIYDEKAIRENARKLHKMQMVDLFNLSLTETFSRTIITSLTTLITVVALLLFGGEMIYGFSLALFIGIVFGTMSSIYVASTWPLFLGITRENLLVAEVKKDQESSFFSFFPDGGSPFGFSPEGGASWSPPSGPPLLLSEEDSVTSVIASPVDAVPSLYATPFT